MLNFLNELFIGLTSFVSRNLENNDFMEMPNVAELSAKGYLHNEEIRQYAHEDLFSGNV